MSHKTISRREFIVGAAATAAGTMFPIHSIRGSDDEFEYVVVGSGAGGGPVAANLARAGHRVLLLEAGDATENNNYRIPAFHGLSTEDPAFSWSFYVNHYSDPVRQAQDSKHVPGRGILYPRAATVGGCTAHNAMITMAPDNSDWDDIVRSTGDASWESGNMRSYFQKMERARYVEPEAGNPQRHGFHGWLSTEQPNLSLLLRDGQLSRLVLAAAKDSGLSADLLRLKLDPNSWDALVDRKEGVFNVPKATHDGRRNGTRELILKTRAEFPQRLILRTNSLVTKVILEEGTNRAIGLEYREGTSLYEADPRSSSASRSAGIKKTVRATREIILAGGAFNTPQLLMLSGIGPKEDLERHRIPVRVNLPGVGKNLQDHYEIGVVSRVNRPLDLIKYCKFGQTEQDSCMRQYERNPESSAYGTNGVVIGLKKRTSPTAHDPEIFLFGIPGVFRGYYPGWAQQAYRSDCFTWAILRGHTRNTAGTVSLRSADPTITPEINFRYFSEGNDASGDDLSAMIRGVRIARRINANPLGASVVKEEAYPGFQVSSNDEVREFVQREAWGHHASCSNKMGPANDEGAVVDSEFRVRGTQGLRIVDASIFPKIPGLFIVVPVYMIAEKASDVILRDARS